MTSAVVHGDPGARKTATLVGQYGVPALYEGRTVVSNIRGFNDLKKIEEVYGKPLPESAELIAVPFTRAGFLKMATFFQWAPVGALILMDEGQRVYPTSLKNLRAFDCSPARETGFVDESTGEKEDIASVEEAFDCHRHMNWDVYISTTNVAKVHKEIRQVAEFGYRQKDLETVSKFMSILLGDIKRVKHNAENSGLNDSHALSSSYHRIDKKVFQVYQSTTTGKVKGTHTKTSILAQPKLLIMLGFLVFTVFRFGNNYATYGSLFPSQQELNAVDAPGANPFMASANAEQIPKANFSTGVDHANGDVLDGRANSVSGLGVEFKGLSPQALAYLQPYMARIDGLPHTAPIYDDLNKPIQRPMPNCIASIRTGDCNCFTQQATKMSVPFDLCHSIVKNGFFDPAKPLETEKRGRSRKDDNQSLARHDQQPYVAPAASPSTIVIKDDHYPFSRSLN